MGTREYPIPISRRQRAQIARWRENVIDLDVVVDDRRQDLDRAADALRNAVRERDRAAAHLQHLIECYADAVPPWTTEHKACGLIVRW